ncbi:GNAT family N-acetyltransferase [Micromonospora sp. NPDC048830]|uniref:GNAT family N-acetyltransferase n=1 Tax=Micromonospora sp. NPDC048830 TaxID=3364257 RepID=UPI00371E6BB6
MPSALRALLSVSGVPGLTCPRDTVHAVRTARLDVSVARLRDLREWTALEDDESRYRQGFSQPGWLASLDAVDPRLPLWSRELAIFVARERGSAALAAHVALAVTPDRQAQVGGSVVAGFRRQGLGREALDAVCAIAHRHLGIRDLTAGCEVSNVASRRWLAACGFG